MLMARTPIADTTPDAPASGPSGRRRGERGAALVTALLAMLVLGAVGTMIAVTVAEDGRVAANHFEVVHCLYTAEAGIQWSLARLAADPNWAGLQPPGRVIAGDRFTVAVADTMADGSPLPPGRRRLTVRVVRGATEREIEVIVQ